MRQVMWSAAILVLNMKVYFSFVTWLANVIQIKGQAIRFVGRLQLIISFQACGILSCNKSKLFSLSQFEYLLPRAQTC